MKFIDNVILLVIFLSKPFGRSPYLHSVEKDIEYSKFISHLYENNIIRTNYIECSILSNKKNRVMFWNS